MTDLTDRELLEAAAKVAGLDIEWLPDGWVHDNDTGRVWNPLTDDGDALRLAVKLGISMTQEQALGLIYCDVVETRIAAEEEYGADPYAATRRAIVRAVAEIGQGMPQPPLAADLPEDNYYKTEAEAFGYGESEMTDHAASVGTTAAEAVAREALEEMQYARTDKAERLTEEALRAIEEVQR